MRISMNMRICIKFLTVYGICCVILSISTMVDHFAQSLKDIIPIIEEEYIGNHEDDIVYWGGVKYTFISQGPKSVSLYIKRGDMMKQGAQAVVDAANLGLGSGSGVTGELQKKVTEFVNNHKIKYKNFIDDIWKKNKPNGLDGIGIAWLNTNENVRVQDKNNIMKIIHAAGPECTKNTITHEQKNQLGQAYATSLQAAENGGIVSVAFPFISSDLYGCGFFDSAQAIIDAILSYLIEHQDTSLQSINIVLYQKDVNINATALERQGWFVKAIRAWAKTMGSQLKKDSKVDKEIINK